MGFEHIGGITIRRNATCAFRGGFVVVKSEILFFQKKREF